MTSVAVEFHEFLKLSLASRAVRFPFRRFQFIDSVLRVNGGCSELIHVSRFVLGFKIILNIDIQSYIRVVEIILLLNKFSLNTDSSDFYFGLRKMRVFQLPHGRLSSRLTQSGTRLNLKYVSLVSAFDLMMSVLPYIDPPTLQISFVQPMAATFK